MAGRSDRSVPSHDYLKDKGDAYIESEYGKSCAVITALDYARLWDWKALVVELKQGILNVEIGR
jgi:hypothetical protein